MPEGYSADFRERAVRLLDDGEVSEYQAIRDISAKLGFSVEMLRRWCRRAGTVTEGVPSESAQLRRLRREDAGLRKVNELLKAASAFFASELDHQ